MTRVVFQIFLVLMMPPCRDYHERLQAWIMFFIDAASFIDIDDDSWRFFLLFEKVMSCVLLGPKHKADSSYDSTYTSWTVQ